VAAGEGVDEVELAMKGKGFLGEKGFCKECIFFQGRGRNQGDCRRYAPREVNQRTAGIAVHQWPRVHEDHWCGEFRSPWLIEPIGPTGPPDRNDG